MENVLWFCREPRILWYLGAGGSKGRESATYPMKERAASFDRMHKGEKISVRKWPVTYDV